MAELISRAPVARSGIQGKVAMIHQAHFAPWSGYFSRMFASDFFLALDNVQYKKNYFHNRTRIVTRLGSTQWLTIPVHRDRHSGLLQDTMIAESWSPRSMTRRLQTEYSRDSFYEQSWPIVIQALDGNSRSLFDINMEILRGVAAKIAHLSDATMPEFGRVSNLTDEPGRTRKLVSACQAVGASSMIMGRDAIMAHDISLIREAGIRVYRQRHISELKFRQNQERASYEKSVEEGVSIFHFASREGWSHVAESLETDWIYTEFDYR